MKGVVAAFNQEKALVGASSMITNHWMDLFDIWCRYLVGYSHFHSLHLDAPVVRGLVQHGLHGPGYALSVTQDLVQILGSQDVSQRSLC